MTKPEIGARFSASQPQTNERDRETDAKLFEGYAMEDYANLGGNSGIAAYEIGPGSITVQFKRGGTYLYTDRTPGAQSVAAMQELAVAGEGLNTFINKHVRNDYEVKLG